MLSSAEGKMLLAYDKASILRALEDLPKEEQNQHERQEADVEAPSPSDARMDIDDRAESYQVLMLILDGMALVL